MSHFHMLFLDGAYIDNKHGSSRFRWFKAPTSAELTQLTHTIAHRVSRYLECQGFLVRGGENTYLTAEGLDADNEAPLNHLLGSSVTYHIAVGPQQGCKAFTLQTLPYCEAENLFVGTVAGLSLHAGVAARAHEREKVRAREAALGVYLHPILPSLCMQEVTHPSVAQSNTVKQSNRCSRGNMECKYKLFFIQISVQIHTHERQLLAVCSYRRYCRTTVSYMA